MAKIQSSSLWHRLAVRSGIIYSWGWQDVVCYHLKCVVKSADTLLIFPKWILLCFFAACIIYFFSMYGGIHVIPGFFLQIHQKHLRSTRWSQTTWRLTNRLSRKQVTSLIPVLLCTCVYNNSLPTLACLCFVSESSNNWWINHIFSILLITEIILLIILFCTPASADQIRSK